MIVSIALLKLSQITALCLAVILALGLSPEPIWGQNSTSFPSKTVIYMGGFFAFPHNPYFVGLQATAEKALDHVNSLEGILDGYHLEMRWNWTGSADPEEALRVLYTLAYTGTPVLITAGPHHSREAMIVNQVAARFNIVQVGLASSTMLTDRSVYPYTVRAYPTGERIEEARAIFFRQMGWRRIAVIFEESISFQTYAVSLREILEANGIQIVASEGVKDVNRLESHLLNIKRQDARIIYIGLLKTPTLKLFCQAYLAGMSGPKYVWIAPRWAATSAWWANPSAEDIAPCTVKQIAHVADTSFHFLGPQRHPDWTDLDYNGVKPLPEHIEYFKGLRSVSSVAHIYDNIIAIALALNASIADLQRLDPPRRLEDFTYSDEEMARAILRNADNIDFIGLQGRVLIENGVQHRDVVYIKQANSTGVSLDTVMVYMAETRRLEKFGSSEIKWKGGRVPVDGITKRAIILDVSSAARTAIFSLAAVGALIAMAFLFLNCKCRNKRAIKVSSPSLGNLTIMGCLFLYTSVFATGWSKKHLSNTAIVVKCHLERILVSLGMSFAFGSIFMKTYRIHAIFTLAVKRFKRIDLPDQKLIGGVLLIALVDVIIFCLWIAIDTTVVYEKTLELRLDIADPSKEIWNAPITRYCSSEHTQYFLIALYGVKGVLLIFGIFLAWETRNIAVSQLNDSKYIAASVYIVALAVALTIPAMTVVSNDVIMTFVIPAVAIVIVNTLVLCLSSGPKVYLLLTTDDHAISLSMMDSFGNGQSSSSNVRGFSTYEDKCTRERLDVKLKQRTAELVRLCKKLQLEYNTEE